MDALGIRLGAGLVVFEPNPASRAQERAQPVILIEAGAEDPAEVLTDTVAVVPGVTCQMPPGPLGVGTVKVILVSLQLLTWNSAASNGAPQLVSPSTKKR